MRFSESVLLIATILNEFLQAKRSATVAWSPLSSHRGLIAVGTVANAIDDSFETTADLEILSIDFSPNSAKEMPSKGTVKSSERFHRLAWGGMSAGMNSFPLGILAGGMVDGSIGLWNPAAIIKYLVDLASSFMLTFA